ncbi:hypothetical protein ACSBR1_003902 [Camellia fascicularis]
MLEDMATNCLVKFLNAYYHVKFLNAYYHRSMFELLEHMSISFFGMFYYYIKFLNSKLAFWSQDCPSKYPPHALRLCVPDNCSRKWNAVVHCLTLEAKRTSVVEMDELVQQAELYRTSWHLLHFFKDYIFLDRCVCKIFGWTSNYIFR